MQFLAIFSLMILALATAAGVYAVVAVILMVCWNEAVTVVFGLPELKWLQAFCLLMVAHLLVKTNVDVKQKEQD